MSAARDVIDRTSYLRDELRELLRTAGRRRLDAEQVQRGERICLLLETAHYYGLDELARYEAVGDPE